MLRMIPWAAAGLVLGFALGGLPGRLELADLRADNDSLRRQVAQASRPALLERLLPRFGTAPSEPESGRVAAGAAPVGPEPSVRAGEPLPGPGTERGAAAPRQGEQPGVAVIGRTDGPSPASRGSERRARRLFGRAPQGGERFDQSAGPSPEERLSRRRAALGDFETVADGQRARAAGLRAALVEQAGLDADQVARLDATTQRMNQRLAGYGEELIDRMVSEAEPTPSVALGLGHDVSGILLEGQKELEGIVGERAGAVDPAAMEVWNYVDLEQWKPFVEQQLEAAAPGSAASPAAGPAQGASGSGARAPAQAE